MTINQMRRALIIMEIRMYKENKVSENQCVLNIHNWYQKSGQLIKEWYNLFFKTIKNDTNK